MLKPKIIRNFSEISNVNFHKASAIVQEQPKQGESINRSLPKSAETEILLESLPVVQHKQRQFHHRLQKQLQQQDQIWTCETTRQNVGLLIKYLNEEYWVHGGESQNSDLRSNCKIGNFDLGLDIMKTLSWT